MVKTIFEEMGGSYVRQGDYFIPCLTLPGEKENKPIGIWGRSTNAICESIKEQSILPYSQVVS